MGGERGCSAASSCLCCDEAEMETGEMDWEGEKRKQMKPTERSNARIRVMGLVRRIGRTTIVAWLSSSLGLT